MKILVLGGGSSTEREVSLRSAAAVTNALKQAGYETLSTDPKDGLSVPANTIVFPILHGEGGEDGSLQRQLEAMKVPYLGTESSASEICFDKSLTRKKLMTNGLPIAEGDEVTEQEYPNHPLAQIPHVVKVCRGGSSIGTCIVRDPTNSDKSAIKEVFELDDKAVIEELVSGVEITVPILDNYALPVIEIVPPTDSEFDYENKYNGKTKEICPPKAINESIQSEAKSLAEQVHKVLGARHLSRIDMIVKANGQIIVLELNTIPGMTEQSLYPLSAKQSGIMMPELMKKFVGMVKRDYKLE